MTALSCPVSEASSAKQQLQLIDVPSRCPMSSSDITTNDFDIFASQVAVDIYDTYNVLRESCPLAYTSQYNGFWLLTRHEDIKKAAMDSDTFISSIKAVIPSDPRGLRRPPLNFDAPHHTPYRKALDRTLKPTRLNRLRPALVKHAEKVLEPLLSAGGGDISGTFGVRFPAWVEVEWLNLDSLIAPVLADTAAAWIIAWRDGNGAEVGKQSGKLYEIARDLLTDRKANPRAADEDPASSLLLERDSHGQPLEEEYLVGALRQSLVVGMVAPPLIISSICVHLANDKELQNLLRSNRSLIPSATEEFLRLYVPYRGFARTSSRDIEMHGRLIRPGEPIALAYSSANRDPEVWDDPNVFKFDRENITQHLGFGRGKHRCAGMPLARMMIQVSLEVLLENTTDIEIDGELAYAKMPEMGVMKCPVKLIQ